MTRAAERPTTMIRALKAGSWDARRMREQLDEELLQDDCPFGGLSARRIWDGLRELQFAYQERDHGWREIPSQFERLARAPDSVVRIGG
jgi:hypothetical protein